MLNLSRIDGITLSVDSSTSAYACYIERFSTALQDEIRTMLSSIWHGEVEAAERRHADYRNTVKRFLESYRKKSPETKKGIIGELLAHLLIPKHIDLKTISIMKNKEEISIRKGFDSVYYGDKSIWYCEVKSGGDVNDEEDIDEKNIQLLKKARRDVLKHALGDRAILWDSVLMDVHATVLDSEEKTRIKDLLDAHHPDAGDREMDRHVILCSVLYKSIRRRMNFSILCKYKKGIREEPDVVGSIVFSIQKSTYKRIEKFLADECKK